jgi:hypothetical protein
VGLPLAKKRRQSRVVHAQVTLDRIDRTHPLSWGWLAVVYGIEQLNWLRPGDAAQLAGTDTGSLRRWVRAGLVTCFRMEAGNHSRYLEREMQIIASLGPRECRPTLAMVEEHIECAIKGGLY